MNRVHRRRILAALGLAPIAWLQRGIAAGRLPLTQGMNQLRGRVLVNDAPASAGQLVRTGDVVATGADSEAIYVIGDNVFMQRSNSRVAISGSATSVSMRLVTGALLSVFGRGDHRLQTATATAGIRCTGAYIEASDAGTYFCLCYGKAELTTPAKPGVVTQIAATHHDTPYMIRGDGELIPSEVGNHSDAELSLLEAIVGRVPPFVPSGARPY